MKLKRIITYWWLGILCCCLASNIEAVDVGGAGQSSGWVLGTSGVSVSSILDEDSMTSDSATALVTQQSVKKYVDDNAGINRWNAETTFSRTDDDTISITVADCTNYEIGTPLRYSENSSTWYYGIVINCTDAGATINVDLDGVPFTTERDAYLEWGDQSVLRTVQLTGIGNAVTGSPYFPKYLWGGHDAYLVRFYISVDTAPTGAAMQGNIECNGNNALDTEWSIAVSGTSTDSGTTINDTTYANAQIEQDEFVEVDVSQVGATVPGGSDAWTLLYFVIP